MGQNTFTITRKSTGGDGTDGGTNIPRHIISSQKLGTNNTRINTLLNSNNRLVVIFVVRLLLLLSLLLLRFAESILLDAVVVVVMVGHNNRNDDTDGSIRIHCFVYPIPIPVAVIVPSTASDCNILIFPCLDGGTRSDRIILL